MEWLVPLREDVLLIFRAELIEYAPSGNQWNSRWYQDGEAMQKRIFESLRVESPNHPVLEQAVRLAFDSPADGAMKDVVRRLNGDVSGRSADDVVALFEAVAKKSTVPAQVSRIRKGSMRIRGVPVEETVTIHFSSTNGAREIAFMCLFDDSTGPRVTYSEGAVEPRK
jgi:hypothetical protein